MSHKKLVSFLHNYFLPILAILCKSATNGYVLRYLNFLMNVKVVSNLLLLIF